MGQTFPTKSECGSYYSCVDVEGKPTVKNIVDAKCPGDNKKCKTIDGSSVCECLDGFESDPGSLNCKRMFLNNSILYLISTLFSCI